MTWLDDLQRRIAIAGARSLGQGFADQIGRTLRGGKDGADVWETATNEPADAAASAPECEWCPVCRAIRMARESRPDLAGRISGTAAALMAAAQDTAAAIDAAFSRLPAQAPAPPAPQAPAPPAPPATAPPAPPATAPPAPPATAPPAPPEGDTGGPTPGTSSSQNGQQD